MHARFEIPIAGKHRRCDQVVIVYRLFDFRMQRAGISNARRATVADKIKSKLIEVCLQSRLGEIIGDDT